MGRSIACSARHLQRSITWCWGKASARASLLKRYMTSRSCSLLADSSVSRTVLRKASSSLLVMQSACRPHAVSVCCQRTRSATPADVSA